MDFSYSLYSQAAGLTERMNGLLKQQLIKLGEALRKIGGLTTFRKRRSWHLVPSLHGK